MSSGVPTASELPTALGAGKPPSAPAVRYDLGVRLRANSEYFAIPVFALLMAAILFALFLLAIGKSPVEFIDYVWRGGFGTAFSFQNTLQRSSPLILTAQIEAPELPAYGGLLRQVLAGDARLSIRGDEAEAGADCRRGDDVPAPEPEARHGQAGLRHIADMGVAAGDRAIEHGDGPRSDGNEAERGADQRRLAGAVRAQHADESAVLDAETGGREDVPAAEPDRHLVEA